MSHHFLISPHPQVAEYFLRKGTDCERWLSAMRGSQQRFIPR